MVDELKLKKYVSITGVLRCKTGTRIGGSKEELAIGVMENPILRDPLDKYPYIPGSSLKGKMRALLELHYGRVGWKYETPNPREGRQGGPYLDKNSGEPCGCRQGLDECPVCTIFGPHKAAGHKLGPTRIIVRDSIVTDEWKDKLKELQEEGLQYAEVKTENIINRRTGVAEHPRPMERVPKDTEFHLNMTLRIFEGDDEVKMKNYIREALDMMQQDYIGGSGTRGYGWVEIRDLQGLD